MFALRAVGSFMVLVVTEKAEASFEPANLHAYTNRPPCLSTRGLEYSCLRRSRLLPCLRAVGLLLGGVVVDLTQYLDSHLESALSVPNAHQGLALLANATDEMRQFQF